MELSALPLSKSTADKVRVVCTDNGDKDTRGLQTEDLLTIATKTDENTNTSNYP